MVTICYANLLPDRMSQGLARICSWGVGRMFNFLLRANSCVLLTCFRSNPYNNISCECPIPPRVAGQCLIPTSETANRCDFKSSVPYSTLSNSLANTSPWSNLRSDHRMRTSTSSIRIRTREFWWSSRLVSVLLMTSKSLDSFCTKSGGLVIRQSFHESSSGIACLLPCQTILLEETMLGLESLFIETNPQLRDG